ncbi:cytochrome P450 9e2-like [Colletes gigas]|uniref:cytochrome P450 9e2-like n=1 Tax=Colletes gigas TaxID=935657 RepID=UPI001C9A6B49|nr:cytochrome P450 9e2-like [Colletes gigas]
MEMDPLMSTLILAAVILFVYRYLWKRSSYFEELGIPHERSIPILGNMAPIVFYRIFAGEHFHRAYNRFKHSKYFGFHNFTTPVIIVRDPDLISSIAIKNFDNFTDHRGFVDGDLDPLMGKNLFALCGDRWREMRKILSPTFTSAKMKTMYKLIAECADRFTEHITMESKGEKVYDMKDAIGRYATDVIATTNFGIAVDSMKDRENEFFVFAKETLNFSPSRTIKMLMGRNFPTLSRLFRIRIFSNAAHRYFTRVIGEAVRTRKEKGIHRPDMIQLMMESSDSNGNELTIDEMTIHAFIFFLAGFDTSSRLLCFVVHMLALNPDVQAKLRAEIDEVARKANGQPTYDAIKDMAYMDAVLNETNRLFPAAGFLDRVCVKEFELPPATPDSKPCTIKPGAVVWFLPFSMHRDPDYFPDPEKFDPSRFIGKEAPPNVYIPFGLGPRICIGNRFALMESKIALYYLLLRCELEPCAKTTNPMRFDKSNFLITPETGFWLKIKARKTAPVSRANGVVTQKAF